MKKLFTLAICALATGFLQAAPLDVSGFSKSLTITVPDASVAQDVSLTNFPALVRLSTSIDGFRYGDFLQSDGGDLAFTDETGEELPYEIDTWNESGESLVWVKVPTLARGTVIHCHYGNASYSPTFAAADMWGTFKGIWHFNSPGAAAGKIGGCASSPVVVADGSAYNPTDPSVFTASGWFKADSAINSYPRLFQRAGAWQIELDPGPDLYAGTTSYGDYNHLRGDEISAIEGNWVHLQFVYSGTDILMYVNGEYKRTAVVPAAPDAGSAAFAIGSKTDGELPLDGMFDEVRLYDGVLSAERISADYATAHDKDFFAYGAVIANAVVNPANYTRFVQLTVGSSALTSGKYLSGVPVLVRLSTALTGFNYSDFNLSRGGDLVFADSAGRIFPHEIDTWNTDGESLVWVKVPLLTRGTVLYAYWGASSASGVASTNTWSAYKGVWHMNAPGASEDGSTVEPDVSGNGLDATPTSNSLSGWGGEPAVTTDRMKSFTEGGVVGSYRRNQTDYAGFIHNYFSIPFYTLGDTFTFSGWFNIKNLYGWHRVVSRKANPGDAGGWHVEWNAGENDCVNVLGAGSGCVTAKTGQFVDEWVALTFAFSGTTLSVYTNGALSASGAVGAVVDNGEILALGNNITGTEASFEGYFDEVRLGAGALSAERIAADYATVHDASFVSFGAVGMPAANAPVMATPVLAKDAQGSMTVSVSMTSGTGTPYARFTSSDGNFDVALADGVVTGPTNFTIGVPGRLASDTTYSFAAVGVNTAGGETVAEGFDTFYIGALAVAKTSDAAENGPVAGVFTVSRADSHGDLAVNYALSGTAVAGTDYVGAASGSVTIPDGSTSATVSVMPKVNSALNADTTVTLSISDGWYAEQASSATMTIANLAPITRRDFLKLVEFTFPMDFLGDGEVLTNFPALVKLSTAIPGFSYSQFQLANGGDMMFTDSSGQVIPSEIDTWDDEGTSLVWVSVPELTKGTVVKMYYGNGANPAGIPLAKWPGYAGVWHMGEASGTAHDSTANGLDAEPVHNNPWAGDQTAIAAGAVGKGRINQMESTRYSVDQPTYASDADVRARSRRSFARVADYSSLEVGSRFTFSGWFKTVHGAEWTEYIACRRVEGNYWGWHVQRLATKNEMDARVSVRVADGGGDFTIPNMQGNWVHLVFSFDKVKEGSTDLGEVTVYGNGELAPLYNGSGRGSTFVHDVALPLTFGNLNDVADGDGYNGQYDELRLKRGTSSANWAKAEYLTVTDASFVSASSVMSAVGGLILFVR